MSALVARRDNAHELCRELNHYQPHDRRDHPDRAGDYPNAHERPDYGGVGGAASMTEHQIDVLNAGAIELTSTQQQVIKILERVKSEKYALSDWYLGAIYAAKNTYNPDRYPQAAQSLRELLEKLPRVFVETEIEESTPGFRGVRDRLYSRLSSDKKRYDGAWKGKTIDAGLDKTIRGVDQYLELNQIPTRKEQIHSVMNKLDPMYDTLDSGIKSEKSERFHTLWKILEGLAHHNTSVDENFFGEQLALVELLIIDLLAPITAQDQRTIQAILSKPHPEQNDVEKLMGLIKRRGANYAFFFKTVESSAWIAPLIENGFFKNPPNVEAAGDGRIITPLWWPIFYLKKVSAQLPEQVVEIILSLEKTDNPRILREIFSIACDLPDVGLSLRLKPLIKRFLQSPYRWGEEDLIVKILQKWGREPGPTRNAAHEIIQYVISYQSDPKESEKRSRRSENPGAWDTSLEPAPRFQEWEYQQILEKGVRPLAEKEPYQVARILIDATASMIRMGMHPEDLDKRQDEDYSEIWCRRLDRPDQDYKDSKETLVHTLTYACEQVYAKAPESIGALDQALRNQCWKVFKRLRLHLYCLYPNDQALPWIREVILGHDDYSKREHNYEFQLMVRNACEHFGAHLLNEVERAVIFDAILSGPSKEDFRESAGDRFSEEVFQQRQRYFHRKQLRPFASLLSGEYRRYYDELEAEHQEKPLSDDDYSPYGGVTGGMVTYRSPRSIDELAKLADEELLAYLNAWDEEHHDKDNWLININIAALAGAFQSLFKDTIVADDRRLAFWMEHRDNVARPVYIESMAKAMQDLVKARNFEKLDQWIEFCTWILSHPDTDRRDGEAEPNDESREHSDWRSSRRAVVDFVDACLKKEVDAPISSRDGLAGLLRSLCTQFDWRLDCDHPVILNRNDQITEAINNTRSRALESIINFGFWVRRHLTEDAVPEVTEILGNRLSEDAGIPLTMPEHALLGMHFGRLCGLDQNWASAHKEMFFPRDNMPVWLEAFGSYLRSNHPARLTFDILKENFQFALEHLERFDGKRASGRELTDTLGQHLVTYYLWEVYLLTGEESLLERFYERTAGDRQRWARLFDHVGRSLRNSGKHLDAKLVERVIVFFNWRFEAGEPQELQKFTFWLDAECLDPDWRLDAYSKILDLGRGKNSGLSTELDTLNKLLPDHMAKVVECFAKITDTMDQSSNFYVSADEAKPILKAGLSSSDLPVRENAERARENLLRVGRFDFLEID